LRAPKLNLNGTFVIRPLGYAISDTRHIAQLADYEQRAAYADADVPPVGSEGPVIPHLDPDTGLLPLGRHRCTEAEVKAAFVLATAFADSATRADIWSDWESGLQVLQSAIVVHAAWLGGSFTTAKVNPADLDVTFLVNAADLRTRGPQDQQVVALFAKAGLVKARLQLRLDTFVVPWECVPRPQLGMNLLQDRYFWARGHWDDWWQRRRLTPKTDPPRPEDAPPRRGYLEVPFSDYP
jgi:hypothetical protein